MFNQIDCILFTLIIFILTYIIAMLLHIPLWLCILSALLMALVCGGIMLHFNSKRQKHLSYSAFIKHLIIFGEEKVASIVSEHFADNFKKTEEFYIYKNMPTFFWLNFSAPSADSLLKLYKKCLASNYSSAIIFVATKDKKLYQFTRFFDNFVFEFTTYKLFFNKLKAKSLLPKIKHNGVKNFRELFMIIIKTAFCKKNCKHFLIASFFIILLSFITPLKVYYLTLAAITTVFAGICLFVKE